MLNAKALQLLQAQVSEIVIDSAKFAKKNWQEDIPYTFKPDKSPVTQVDIATEQFLQEKLSRLLPEAGFILEEHENILKDGYNWVIDPLDQTKNFISRLPLFYIQVGLVYKNEPILGVIYNPISEQLFEGTLNNGVLLNKNRLRISDIITEINNYIDIDFGSGNADNDWKMQILSALLKEKYKFRLTGASYAIYILTQAIQGYLVLNQQTKPVDQLPRIILMREFGLQCKSLTVNGNKIIIAGKEKLFNDILNIVNGRA